MNVKGLSSVTMELMKDVEAVRSGFPLGARVTVTNLGRSTEWRRQLQEHKFLEVVDRTQTAGVLLKPEVFSAMLKYIETLETERDQSEIDLLITLREHRQNWQSGQELAEQAKESARQRRQDIRETLNDGK